MFPHLSESSHPRPSDGRVWRNQIAKFPMWPLYGSLIRDRDPHLASLVAPVGQGWTIWEVVLDMSLRDQEPSKERFEKSHIVP